MNTPASILIVEDEKVLQDVYKMVLGSKGFTVFTANNGIEGLTELKRTKPNVVLLDIFMPLMDGREFLRNMDKADYPQTRVVVCSNLSDNTIVQEMLGNGADKYVLKSSLGPDELLKLVQEQLSQK